MSFFLPKLHEVDRVVIGTAAQRGATLMTLDSCMPGGGPAAIKRALAAMDSTPGPHTTITPDLTGAAFTSEATDTVRITPDLLAQMGKSAVATSDLQHDLAERLMTLVRATAVRRLRVGEHASWRYIAAECHTQWASQLSPDDGSIWQPPHNQLMGMALCEAAARLFREDYMAPPWN